MHKSHTIQLSIASLLFSKLLQGTPRNGDKDSPNVPMTFLRKGLDLKKADISQTTLGGLQEKKKMLQGEASFEQIFLWSLCLKCLHQSEASISTGFIMRWKQST